MGYGGQVRQPQGAVGRSIAVGIPHVRGGEGWPRHPLQRTSRPGRRGSHAHRPGRIGLRFSGLGLNDGGLFSTGGIRRGGPTRARDTSSCACSCPTARRGALSGGSGRNGTQWKRRSSCSTGRRTCVRQFSWPITVRPSASIACRVARSVGQQAAAFFSGRRRRSRSKSYALTRSRRRGRFRWRNLSFSARPFMAGRRGCRRT